MSFFLSFCVSAFFQNFFKKEYDCNFWRISHSEKEMGLSSSKMTKSNINVVHRMLYSFFFFLQLYKGFVWGSDWNLLNENPDICLSSIWCITLGHERTLISWINCSFDFNLFIESLHLILKNGLNDLFGISSLQIYHMNNLHSYLYLVPIHCNFMERVTSEVWSMEGKVTWLWNEN